MLIKNEISFKGIVGHQTPNGSLVMIILYILSLFGCLLIAIIILKLFISCFFTDKFKLLFCITSGESVVKAGDECNSIGPEGRDGTHLSADALNQQTVSHLGSILIKLSETQIGLRGAKQQCICPICANDHIREPMATLDRDGNGGDLSLVSVLRTPIPAKRGSLLSKSMQKLRTTSSMDRKRTAIQMDLMKALDKSLAKNMSQLKTTTVPMISRTQTERIIVSSKRSPDSRSVVSVAADGKQMASYSDVVLELKQRFSSSMSALNTTV